MSAPKLDKRHRWVVTYKETYPLTPDESVLGEKTTYTCASCKRIQVLDTTLPLQFYAAFVNDQMQPGRFDVSEIKALMGVQEKTT